MAIPISDLQPVVMKEIYPNPDFKFWDFFKPAEENPAHVIVSPEVYMNGDGTKVACWCGEYHDNMETP